MKKVKKVIWNEDHILINPEFLGECICSMEPYILGVFLHILLTGSYENGKKGLCNLSIPEIAHKTGIKEKVVFDCLKKLRRKKRITIEGSLKKRARLFRYSHELVIKPNIRPTELG